MSNARRADSGNRKKRRRAPEQEEKHVSAFRFYFINFFLLFIILGTVLFGAAFFMCTVNDVECSGSTVYTDAELKRFYLSDKYSGNTIYVFFKNRFKPAKIKNIPFIEDYSISIKDKNSLRIKVKEKEVIGYYVLKDGKWAYFDSNGVVQEISDTQLEGLVSITGLKMEEPEVGEVLAIGSANVSTVTKVLQYIKENEIQNVSEVQFSNDGTIVLLAKDITINLGTRSKLAEKLKRVKYIMPQIEGKKGTLHLEEWSEKNTDIVFNENTK